MFSGKFKKSILKTDETGTALVIALLVMVMLLGFAALALSRAVSETAITTNDTAESRSYSAAEAALEDATRDFATVVENKLVPAPSDITTIENSLVPYFSDDNKYTFTKTITQTRTSETVTQTKGEFQGLVSLRDEWQINVIAHDNITGVETEVQRRFFNDRIPIFQFGAFYDDDLELNRPPLFVFGGRVHTNGNLFVSAYPLANDGGIYFKSKLTASGEIVNDIWKTGTGLANPWDNNGDVYIPNTNGDNQQLAVGNGSVICGGTGNALVDPTIRFGTANAFPYPNCRQNPNWNTSAQRFEGNLIARASKLKLPVAKINQDLVEMVRRGKNVGDINSGGTAPVTAASQDNVILSKERFANKHGIRISLADSKNKLPQCFNVSTACGVRLDGTFGTSIGYQPLPMTDSYMATALNGNRLAISGREVWIKIELVSYNYDNGVPITKDVTQDILSLGVTETAPVDSKFKISGYTTFNDSRSIVKLQRFAIPGAAIPNPSGTSYLENKNVNSNSFNAVVRYEKAPAVICIPIPLTSCIPKNVFASSMTKTGSTSVSSDETSHFKLATFDGNWSINSQSVIVPFPIQLFDAREGARNDNDGGLVNKVYKNGVISIVDIDIANLRRFLNGDFNGKFPVTTPFAISNGNIGLRSSDIPDQRGWVIYFSDRRGDADFDGMYDMEDVNPNSNSLIDEDLNNNGTIDTDYTNEAPSADSSVDTAYAAVADHTFYRRGVRLINGSLIPGSYDSLNEANTKGFTFASENGIYVQGNFNVTSVSLPGGTTVADSSRYSPLNTDNHIPAAVIGDAVTILSNAWNDAKSFVNPFDDRLRVASDTQVRFGMIAGDSLTARPSPTPAAGTFEGLNGGIHNFKRYLEDWDTTNQRLNYSGSLINLYNSFNNDGRWKCCTTVYKPPIRDWTFESSFTNPHRLPPGTPFVYYMTFTGFERVND